MAKFLDVFKGVLPDSEIKWLPETDELIAQTVESLLKAALQKTGDPELALEALAIALGQAAGVSQLAREDFELLLGDAVCAHETQLLKEGGPKPTSDTAEAPLLFTPKS